MNKVVIVGSGYVGLVAGACLAELGNHVICVDKNIEKIKALKDGKIPIYEPGLEELVKKNSDCKRLNFTIDIKAAVEESKVIVIAVGTPSAEDGSADLQYVLQAANDIAQSMNNYKIIVNKSTVPVGTGQKVKESISKILKNRRVNYLFDVVSNPEFLREGSAVQDFLNPDRIVLGVESKEAEITIRKIYGTFDGDKIPFIVTNLETAEMIKYATNAFLAMKITYINEVANLCEKVGADVDVVARAMGTDQRISPKFLQPGAGYGGSCFPKDTRAIAKMGRNLGVPLTLIEQTIVANENQKHKMVEKIKTALGSLEGKTFGVLGITFKPETDDIREAPSLIILKALAMEGAILRVYDPAGEKEGKWRFAFIKENLLFCDSRDKAIDGVDALIILTEWNEFKNMNLDQIKNQMRGNYFFDFRNLYDRKAVEKKGFQYYGVGR